MAKRGENIRRRKDGRWEGRYIKSRTSERKPVWGYVYGSAYADVKEILIRKKAEAGFYALSRTELIFRELAEQWLASIRVSIKESSFAHYQYTLRKYILPVLKDVRVSNLSENILEQAMQVIISPRNQEHRPLGHKDWPELPFAHREHIGCTVDYVAGRNRYIGYLISLGIYSFKGVKVGLDCANGSSWNIAKSVFDALGADTYVINNNPNGLNINNNAGSTHIEGLQKFVVEKGLDVGFAYDGDADRCLCVDEKGNVITGDHILYIYGCYMKERGKLLTNTVVTTVMSNFGLYKAFDEKGIGYAKTAVGDKYVYEYMAKNGCRIGGEQSGHIIFSKYASTGDGILTSLKMMEVMLAKKKPMSELAAPLKIYPQVLENVRVTDKKAAQNDEAVQAAVKNVAEALGDTGRILVRESGTEPVVRVMVEAPDHDTCQKYVSEVVNVICEKGYKA